MIQIIISNSFSGKQRLPQIAVKYSAVIRLTDHIFRRKRAMLLLLLDIGFVREYEPEDLRCYDREKRNSG